MVKMTQSATVRAEREIGELIIGEKRKRVSDRVETGTKESLSWLMATLIKIIASKSPTMEKHKCVFQDDTRTAETNAKWL